MTMYDWYFTAADGFNNVIGGEKHKTERAAILAGKRWLKTTDRKGIITAIKAEKAPINYILDY